MRPNPADGWNGGRGRELLSPESIDTEKVYCVTCGNVFVSGTRRHCPACTIAEAIEELSPEGEAVWE